MALWVVEGCEGDEEWAEYEGEDEGWSEEEGRSDCLDEEEMHEEVGFT